VINVKVETIKVMSFTTDPNGGNPAGVVLQPGQLTDEQMKTISQKLNVSETAYVFPSKSADYHVRFFSPATEVDLCGHATIATFTVIGQQLQSENKDVIELTQQTKAGILPVRLHYKKDNSLDFVLMRQRKPQIESVTYNTRSLAKALNISKASICNDFPQERVSTGLFTLPVCVSSYQVLQEMKPDFHLVTQFCQKVGVGSLHVFTFDTLEQDSVYHARNFAPVYDINEDPVTGTANGAVCSYLRYHHRITESELICEQGDIIGRKGRVRVTLNDDEVWIGGQAVIKETTTLSV